MALLGGIYAIRNYRTRNHATLLRELGDIVACQGYYSTGEKWQVTRVIENDRYEIRNVDKPEYYASCHHRPTPGEDAYLGGLPRRQLWTIREDTLGKRVNADLKTYTILADESGGYWTFKTGEPNSQTILTREPPNDWSLWVFEPVDVNGFDLLGQPCKHLSHHHSVSFPISTGTERENRCNHVHNMTGSEFTTYFNQIPRVDGAAYNSWQRDFRTGCLNGTREYPLSAVHEWVRSPTPPLFWLNGLAGTGKTTIAHSVAEYYDERNQLGASFFFSRDQQDRRDTRQVISTIAYQLGKAYPEIVEHIAAAIKNQNPLHSNSRTQLRQLIVEPLSTLPRQNSRATVVVIDALDESDDHKAAANIVELLATELPRTLLPLKFFVTSRPEKDLRSKFLAGTVSSETQTLILHEIDVGTVQKVINLFLQVRLTEIAERHKDVISQKTTRWPTAAEIDALTERAGGLFIFASSVVGFLDESSYRAPERLSSILNAKLTASSSNLNPYANLDKLYHQILEYMLHAGPDSSEDTAVMFRHVVGTILLLRRRASCEDLSALLNTGTDIVDVRGALMHLHSVIKVPTEDQPTEEEDGPSEVENESNEEYDEPDEEEEERSKKIEIFHKSFHDYLTDPARCTDSRLFIDPSIQHRIIAETCLNKMINSLELFHSRTIYNCRPPHNSEPPPWLYYACSEWTEHGLACLPDKKLLDLTQMFFSTSSLNWIMVLAMWASGICDFMGCMEQAAQLGLVWTPFMSICLRHLGVSLFNPHRAYNYDNYGYQAMECFIFASILAVGLTPCDSGCYFACAFDEVLSPVVSMTSYIEMKHSDWDFWSLVDLEWLKSASVRAPPGSAAQTAYYHILGCIAYRQEEPHESVEWFEKALSVNAAGHGPSFGMLRDVIAARCSGARRDRNFLCNPWRLPVQVVENYIQSIEKAGESRADYLFTLGNLYWLRFQLIENNPNSNDIDMSIQYLQNAVNTAQTNCLPYESLRNLGHSLCARCELYGSHADIDAAEKCYREAEEYPCASPLAMIYLVRDLSHARYKCFKLWGQREDIENSIRHLMEARRCVVKYHLDGLLMHKYLVKVYNALRKLERTNPGAGIEILRRFHDPDNRTEVNMLNDLIADRPSPLYYESGDDSDIGSEDEVPMQEDSALEIITNDERER